MVAILVKSVQEQQEIINELHNENNNLKTQMRNILDRLEKLEK